MPIPASGWTLAPRDTEISNHLSQWDNPVVEEGPPVQVDAMDKYANLIRKVVANRAGVVSVSEPFFVKWLICRRSPNKKGCFFFTLSCHSNLSNFFWV